jgi:hypothetical protein
VQARPLEHELDGQGGPRLAAVHHHHRQVGEVVEDLVEPLDVLGPARHAGADDAAVDADGDAQLHARAVERVHLAVVERDLGVGAAGEAAGGDHAVLVPRGPQVAHGVDAPVGVESGRQVEAAGVLALGPDAVVAQADHGLVDAVGVHGGDRPGDGVDVLAHHVGHALEHVLDRELELLRALPVLEQGAEEVVRGPLLLDGLVWEAHPEVDDPDVGRYAHACTPSVPKLRV